MTVARRNNKYMRGDLQVIGPQFSRRLHQAASSTRVEYGEPMISTSTLSSGAASSNEWVLAAADFLVSAGTQTFGGIAMKGSTPFRTGTVTASYIHARTPLMGGTIRGKAETAAAADTDAEILAVQGDAVLVDYNSTGGSDGGELYTIKAASADTSLFQVAWGDSARGTLDIFIYPTVYRTNQDIS
jgi:hypothetical protein